MENVFNQLCEKIFGQLKQGEYLTISFGGESSQFIRFNNSKIRQTGLIDDSGIGLELIYNNRTCSSGSPFIGDLDADFESALAELNRLRTEVLQLPEDPYIVLPENKGSSRDVHAGKLLPSEKAPDALTPAISGVDLSGIWASGSIFRGNANSEGQKHWFATETFAFDYSLVTPEEKMVKATFAGSKWNQSDYESYAALSIQQLEKMKIAPRTIKPGKYRAYIAPAGVADILSMFSWGGVSEASIQQGDSAFLKMRKEKIKLSPLFSLAEDFTTGTVPRFNARGEIATEVLPIINKGVLENTLISSRTAKEYGKKSNNASDWEGMRAPIMSGGGLPETDILKALGTGVYLSNLHYLNWSDRIGGRITGMTRYACFWVENGEIVAPIENMRFDDSIYSFFGPELEAVTEKPQLIPDVGTYEGRELGGIICPGILLKSFDLTL